MQGWGGWCWQGNGAEWRTSVLRRCSQIGRFWFLLYSGRIFKDTRKSAVFGLFRSRFLKCLQIGSGGRGSSWPPGIQLWSSTRWWRWSTKKSLYLENIYPYKNNTFFWAMFYKWISFFLFWAYVCSMRWWRWSRIGGGGDAGGRRAGVGGGGAACNPPGWPVMSFVLWVTNVYISIPAIIWHYMSNMNNRNTVIISLLKPPCRRSCWTGPS